MKNTFLPLLLSVCFIGESCAMERAPRLPSQEKGIFKVIDHCFSLLVASECLWRAWAGDSYNGCAKCCKETYDINLPKNDNYQVSSSLCYGCCCCSCCSSCAACGPCGPVAVSTVFVTAPVIYLSMEKVRHRKEFEKIYGDRG